MFLDSLVGDAAWRAKYAKDLDGKSIPFDIIEEEIKSTHPFAVFGLRAMLSVSYFEKVSFLFSFLIVILFNALTLTHWYLTFYTNRLPNPFIGTVRTTRVGSDCRENPIVSR